jgi:hypothetical protein
MTTMCPIGELPDFGLEREPSFAGNEEEAPPLQAATLKPVRHIESARADLFNGKHLLLDVRANGTFGKKRS